MEREKQNPQPQKSSGQSMPFKDAGKEQEQKNKSAQEAQRQKDQSEPFDRNAGRQGFSSEKH